MSIEKALIMIPHPPLSCSAGCFSSVHPAAPDSAIRVQADILSLSSRSLSEKQISNKFLGKVISTFWHP